jgi:WD40 repeat protein
LAPRTLKNGRMLKGQTAGVYSIASLMGEHSKILVSASHDESLKFWDTDTFTCFSTVKCELSYIFSVVVFDDNKLAFSTENKYIYICEVINGVQLHYTLSGHMSYARCLLIRQDSNLLASGSNDKSIKIWDDKDK